MPTFPVPNFRLPTRLVSWMRENSVSERIPEREFVFFKENLPVSTRALTLVSYASQVRNGRLPAEMEALILQHPAACLKYANFLRKSCIPAIPVPDEIVDRFCILGDTDEHIRRLTELKDLGVDQFAIYLQHDGKEETLEAYGEKILPAIQELGKAKQ